MSPPPSSAEELRSVLRRLAGSADIIMLTSQPLTWGGTTNPFALLPHQRAANFGFSGALVPDFEALLRARTNAAARKKMRKKERALRRLRRRAIRARDTAPRRARACSMPSSSRRARACARIGVPDVFAVPGVRRFIEAAATERASTAASR